MKIVFLLLACIWVAQIANAEVDPPVNAMGLAETIRTAIDNSPTIDAAQKTVAVNALQYKSSIAKLLPSLDFTTTDGLQNNIAVSSNQDALFFSNPTAPWASSLNLGLTESLYDNGVTLTSIAISDLNRTLADVSAQKARDTLVLNIATEFYTYSQSKVLLQVRIQQKKILDKQYELLEAQYQQGFKTRADYLRLKTQVQQAEIDLISAEDAIQQSLARLKGDMGVNDKPGKEVSDFIPVEVNRNERFDILENAKAPELADFYDMRLGKIQTDINDKNVDLVKRQYYPQISLNGGVAYQNQSFLNSTTPFEDGHQLSWNALVTIQYNLWDWGIRNRNIDVAEYSRDIQTDTINLGLEQVHSSVEQLISGFTRIHRNYKLSLDLLAMEEESNRLVEQQYQDGKVTYLDLITSLTELLNAKVQYYSAYYEALLNVAKYDYYKGNIYDSLTK
jgi:outer membrane protein TolC